MGIRPSFPIKHDQIFFEPPANFSCSGKRREEVIVNVNTSFFHTIRAPFWEGLMKERKNDLEAKKKFYDMDEEVIEALTIKFEKFKAADIEDLRFQFQCFDMNNDGLIDKPELMHALDDMGDTSGPQKREQCFQEVDEDGSGAIDFEEFLGLIYRLRNEIEKEGDDMKNTIALMSKRESDNVNALRRLSVSEQMSNHLF